MANFLKSLFIKGVEIDTASAITGNSLIYNGTKFAPATPGTGSIALDGLSDVVITTPAEFQTLEYNGTNWVNTYASVVSYVRNAEATTLTTGTCVYLFGATGDHATVKRADHNSDATSAKTVGVIGANITANNHGPVVTRGYVDGIDLSVGYTAGDILWLGEAGAFTKTKPTAPDHLVFIGVVVRATNNGIIYVATQNGYELDELHNVSLPSPASGDFLKYNGSLWVADSIDLGTDTTGNYMSGISGTSPVSVAHTAGEGSSATVALASGYGDTQNPYASKTANYFLASPNGSASTPSFRAIVAADIPTLNQNTTGNAATASAVAAANLTGATLASGVTGSSLTSLGTLTGLTVSNNVTAATFTGGSANSANPVVTLNGVSGSGALSLFNDMGAGSYNGIVTAGSKGIIFAGANSTTTKAAFAIAPWSDTPYGIRLTGGATTDILVRGTSTFTPTLAANKALIVQGVASQAGDFFDVQNSGGTSQFKVDSAGNVGIGGTPAAGRTLTLLKNITGSTASQGIRQAGEIQSDVTSSVQVYRSSVTTAATSFTLTTLANYYVAGVATPGAGSTITNQYGFWVDAFTTGATNNYGFRGQIASGTNRYNLYMDGTADNYLGGRLGVGAVLTSGAMAQVTNTTAADKAFVVKGAASQSGDFLDVQNSGGFSLFKINSAGAGWFRQEANGLQINLNLGRMDDGLTTPLYQVQTDDTNGDILRFYSTRWSSNVKFARSSATGDMDIVTISGGGGDNRIELFDSVTNAVNSRITSSGTSFLMGGNVGIGTTTPATKLDVNGTITGTSFNSITGLSSTTPAAAGTAAVGTSTTTARADHVHSNTADHFITTNNGNGSNFKVGDDVWIGDINLANVMSVRGVASAASGFIRFGSDTNNLGYNGTAFSYGGAMTATSFNSITGLSSTTPIVDGTAAVGTGTTTARGDHVHPTDTSRAPIASPTFTGTVNSIKNFGDTHFSSFAAKADSSAQGLLAGYSFYPTFVGTGDNGVRRAADIWAGYNGGAWGNEYLSFGVGTGAGNDVGSKTTERMRISGAGNVGIGTTTPSTALDVVGTTTLKTVKAGSGTVAISSTSYASLYATSTYNTSTPHGFATGDTVAVTGITPSSWNRTATVTVGSSTSFYFSLFNGSTGGAYSSGGTATGPPSTLYVDITNDRIGIGTSSPATKLDVVGTITARTTAAQDGVALAGRAGGTSTYEVTLTPTTLTADRTLTLPDASGTVALTSDPGLILIKTQTVGSAVASVTVTGAFSADYDNYKIMYIGGTVSASTDIEMTIGGSVTGYYGFLSYGVSNTTTPLGAGRNNTASLPWVGGGVAGQASFANVEIMGPFKAAYTKIRNASYQNDNNYGTMQGEHRVATSYTSFALAVLTGTMTGGTIRVYGYRNS